MRGILFSVSEKIMPHEVGLSEEDRTRPLAGSGFQDMPYREAKEQLLLQFNRTFIGDLLASNKGNVTQAARQCGLERQALQQIMKRYGIKADIYRQ
jgi:DNA-binding NtrC family response regulator